MGDSYQEIHGACINRVDSIEAALSENRQKSHVKEQSPSNRKACDMLDIALEQPTAKFGIKPGQFKTFCPATLYQVIHELNHL